MTLKQYTVLLELYNEFNEAFQCLSFEIQSEFYDILYCRKEAT